MVSPVPEQKPRFVSTALRGCESRTNSYTAQMLRGIRDNEARPLNVTQ